MLKNILKTALRSLLRHRSYSLISLSGLAIGFACCMAAFLYVQHEISYDRYHEKSDRIYRLINHSQIENYGGIAKVNGWWGRIAVENLPEVEEMTRFVIMGQVLFTQGNKRFYEANGLYADSTLFDVFSFELLQGKKETALSQPNSIVLTKSLAEKYFGSADVVGKTITLNTNRSVVVSGVLADVPSPSHLSFSFLLPARDYGPLEPSNRPRGNQYYTYLLLKPGVSAAGISEKFKSVLKTHLEPDQFENAHPALQPLIDIHLHSNLFRELSPNSDVSYVYIFAGIGLLVLVISSINFVNLSTARAMLRTKEVGIRKSNGAFRGQLITQYLGESVMLSLISLLLSVAVLYTGLPFVNATLNKSLTIDFTNLPFVGGALFCSLFVGLIAGSYPALFLANLKPALVLKGLPQSNGKNHLRETLVVAQFAISAFLIVSVAIIYNQLTFIQNKKLGFRPSELITIPISDHVFREKADAIKNELLKHPSIESVSLSGNLPGGGDWGIPYQPEGIDAENAPAMRILAVDHDFIQTFQMELAQGRNFSKGVVSDTAAYIINEEAAKQLGWTNPLEKKIAMEGIGRAPAQVVGVVKDFHFRSLKEKIGPVMLVMPPTGWMIYYTVRLKTHQLEEGLKSVEQTWALFDTTHPFTYTFFDQTYGNLYASERQLGKLVGYFSGIAIFLACMGLFSLAAFTTEQRTKEVGIRKVLGASVSSIAWLLSRDLVRLVIIGFVLAAPAGYYLMSRWLSGFVYRVEISMTTFLLTGAMTLLLAWLTVSFKVMKAGMANPVNALRSE